MQNIHRIFSLLGILIFTVCIQVEAQNKADWATKAEKITSGGWGPLVNAHIDHFIVKPKGELALGTALVDWASIDGKGALAYIKSEMAKQTEDGALPASLNSPLWVLAVEDYVKRSNQREASAELFPALKKYLAFYDKSYKQGDASYLINGKKIYATSMAYLLYSTAGKWAIRAKESPTEFNDEAKTIKALIEWSFYNNDLKTFLEPGSNAVTISMVWPLIVGSCTVDQAQGVINFLLNPAKFFTKHPSPETIGKVTSNNLNAYWASRAAWNQGRSNAAESILNAVLKETEEELGSQNFLMKNYNSNGKPSLLLNKTLADKKHSGNNPMFAIAYLAKYIQDNKIGN
jgi:hypothetical protein